MSSSEVPAANQLKPRIVIVDDEFFVAWHLQSMLLDLNFDVCEIAGDAETAVDCVLRQEADLVLMDLNLGEGPDGIETLQLIRKYRNVTAIFITAYADETNLTRIRRASPDSPILSKPISAEILQSVIIAAIKGHR